MCCPLIPGWLVLCLYLLCLYLLHGLQGRRVLRLLRLLLYLLLLLLLGHGLRLLTNSSSLSDWDLETRGKWLIQRLRWLWHLLSFRLGRRHVFGGIG